MKPENMTIISDGWIQLDSLWGEKIFAESGFCRQWHWTLHVFSIHLNTVKVWL